MEEILILQMGGTIDKDYPKTKAGYSFEVGEPAVRRILTRLRPSRSIITKIETVCRKDSQDITDEDRSELLEKVSGASQSRLVVTHGTDTLIETATFLASGLRERGVTAKTIVFTGSFSPEKFRDTDADFNVGVALGGVQAASPGVWVAMNGILLAWDRVDRDDTGQFVPRRRSYAVTV
ncbi:probable L-asparaginase 4 isoform X2 [Penaeus chinensis]|uniref:probable L-asparaginase 4 isoform X2 n=1 Tax=Penaeus chinensis TaxID=139456 RepID=UPI001FB7E1F7|nr:probable L-asparaginase 4 isoform X2 [Penaeus chinensis]